MSDTTAEQQARDMLERIGVADAQSFSAGDLVELANLIAERDARRQRLRNTGGVQFGSAGCASGGPGGSSYIIRGDGADPELAGLWR